MPTRRSFLPLAAATAVSFAAMPALSQDDTEAGPSAAGEKLPPALAALTSRRAEAVPILLAEREQRLERARHLMTQQGTHALVICTGTSLRYFTGLRWGQSERFFAWVLPARSAPFVVCPVFEEPRVRERMESKPPTLPAAAQTRVYAWNEDESPFLLLGRALKDAGIASGRVGLEERTQFAFADGIAQALRGISVVNGTPVTAGCRSLKTPAELALMQLANNVTLSVYEAAFKSLQTGMTNHQVSAMIAAAYDHIGFPGEASCEIGPNSAVPHGTLQPQVIRESEIILLDDGCSVEGYQSDISRSLVLGRATDKQKKIFDIVHRAQAAALAAAHPGVPCSAIDAAGRKILADAGYGPGYKYLTHRLGHGIGMDGHEWPYLVGGSTTALAAGMCFSDEPGIYLPGEFGIRLEDDWHVTEDGGRFFTPQSPSLEAPFAKA